MDGDQFAAYLAMQSMSTNTIRTYRAMWLRYVDWCLVHDAHPYEMQPLEVLAWAQDLPPARSTMAQARATIGHASRALGRDDASVVVPLPRRPPTKPRGLPLSDARRLVEMAKVSGQAGTAVLVGLYTAARRSEIAGFMWADVDWDRRTVSFWRPKVRDRHTVPLHPALAAHLEPRASSGERWLFPGRHGGHVAPSTIWAWVVDVAERAGLDRVTPHQLRHTALTMANDNTMDLRAVQDFAGHMSPTTTAIYTATSGARLRRAVAALDYQPA